MKEKNISVYTTRAYERVTSGLTSEIGHDEREEERRWMVGIDPFESSFPNRAARAAHTSLLHLTLTLILNSSSTSTMGVLTYSSYGTSSLVVIIGLYLLLSGKLSHSVPPTHHQSCREAKRHQLQCTPSGRARAGSSARCCRAGPSAFSTSRCRFLEGFGHLPFNRSRSPSHLTARYFP